MLDPPLARANCTEDSNTNCRESTAFNFQQRSHLHIRFEIVSQAEVQILACDMVIINRTIAIDAAYGTPVHEQQQLSRLNDTWNDWAATSATPASASLQDTVHTRSLRVRIVYVYLSP